MLKVKLFGVSALSVVACALMSCTGNDYTYSDYHCNLYIDNSTHQDATLQSAMNPSSPGVFCYITFVSSPRPSYRFLSNQRQSSVSAFNAIDTQRGNASRIGMNNGLYVGYSNLSTDVSGNYTFYAYDAQCPNCFDYNSLPLRNYSIVVKSAGIGTCKHCGRQYNLNTGGNCINSTSAGDKGLSRYRATTTGPLGLLYVN